MVADGIQMLLVGLLKEVHLEVIKWLRENGCEWDCEAISEAAANGHQEVVEWLRANGCEES